ncbi:MAG: hypothetical protein JW772_00540, partial [Candidatus Diapherotrites archaeon]|nr:hypothetical protein [Candidatus Diapherotrites archaeon]
MPRKLKSIELSEKASVIGRSLSDFEKYGARGTGYLGKVLMSGGERPVLGRKILMDLAKSHLVLICGKRGGGKCVTGDTLITLEDGSVKPIKELEHDNRKILAMNEEFKIAPTHKTEFFKRTVNKILEVKLRSGKKIKLTPEHPLLTIQGWRPAQELKAGGRIATPRIQPAFGSEFLSESEVKLLAYLVAEGHTKGRVVWFTNQDAKIVTDFRQAVREFDTNLGVNKFGECTYRIVNKNPKFEIIESVREKGKFAKGIKFKAQNTLRQRLKEFGVYDLTGQDKKIAGKIFNLPEQKIALFLNRLFSCDGTIYFDTNTKSWRVAYASVSEEIARAVQHMLSKFGTQCVLREKENVLNGKKFKSFELELKGINVEIFLKKIGFFGEKEKKQKLALEDAANKKRNPNTDTVPKEIWETYRPENWAEIGRKTGLAFPKSMRESIHYSPSREKLMQIAMLDNNEFIQKIASSEIFWDEIKEIKELTGEFEVYDICVPENHNFVANDIIIHNSYTMAVLLEEFARLDPEVKARTTVICIDTVGIFWSLKLANRESVKALAEWDLKPEETKVRVLVPKGKLDFYKEKGLPADGSFTIKTSELGAVEWMALFKLTWKDPEGVLITRVIETLQEKMGTYFGTQEIITAIN